MLEDVGRCWSEVRGDGIVVSGRSMWEVWESEEGATEACLSGYHDHRGSDYDQGSIIQKLWPD